MENILNDGATYFLDVAIKLLKLILFVKLLVTQFWKAPSGQLRVSFKIVYSRWSETESRSFQLLMISNQTKIRNPTKSHELHEIWFNYKHHF